MDHLRGELLQPDDVEISKSGVKQAKIKCGGWMDKGGEILRRNQ